MAEKFLGLSPGLLEALDARGRNPLHYAAAKGASQPGTGCAAQKLPGCQDYACAWLPAHTLHMVATSLARYTCEQKCKSRSQCAQ